MDTASYRLSESLGRRAIRSLRQTGIHAPEFFQSTGFLTRVDSQEDLIALLDVMHDNRFDDFVAELGGLPDDAFAELVDGFVDYARFFMAHFPSAEVPMPLSGMLSQYALARKIRGIPQRARVLEIGPGTGLVSLFLARDPAIERYDQIEASESFYLLQSLLNRHVYGHRFLDHAQLDATAAGLGDIAFEALRAARADILPNYEPPSTLRVDRRPRCEHIPWWRLSLVAGRRYDVVTSNANLTEFSEPALRYYMTLAARVLEPHGVLLAQCPGGGKTPAGTMLSTVTAAGFAPLAIVPRHLDGVTRPPAQLPAGKQMAVANLIYLLPGHPNFAKTARPGQPVPFADPNDPLTRSVLGFDWPKGPARSRDEMLSAIAGRLATLD